MIDGAGDAWFAAHTAGAPEALRRRAERFVMQASPRDLARRLSQAGNAALREAARSGAGREAALDLLAADALITLALLLAAEQDPARLGATAAGLRLQATSTP
jgi:hypothetical protein